MNNLHVLSIVRFSYHYQLMSLNARMLLWPCYPFCPAKLLLPLSRGRT